MPTRKKARSTVVGVFDTRDRAEQAMADYLLAGLLAAPRRVVIPQPASRRWPT